MKSKYIKIVEIKKPKLTRQDKIERIEKLAQKMGIKIGGTDEDREKNS